MGRTFDFTKADLIMTVGGHLFLLILLAFILLSDIGVTSFPTKEVKEMVQEMIPSAGISAK
mgnify:CR=1 FL=1